MKPLRKNLAIAIDGGGLRGIIIARALLMLEKELGQPISKLARLLAGTSTGSVIASSIAVGLNAEEIHTLYLSLASQIFKKSWRTAPVIGLFANYQYDPASLRQALSGKLGDGTLGDFWKTDPKTDLVITTYDLVQNRPRFLKPWKSEFKDWPLIKAVLASSAAPTYFPPVDGRYTDGGVGSYNNPCYLAAFEAQFCLGWDPAETTLISLGAGRPLSNIHSGEPNRWHLWNWLDPLLNSFIDGANDQQVNVVDSLFPKLDFRRFQVDLREVVGIDDPTKIPVLEDYGDEMGDMILNDRYDRAQGITPERPHDH